MLATKREGPYYHYYHYLSLLLLLLIQLLVLRLLLLSILNSSMLLKLHLVVLLRTDPIVTTATQCFPGRHDSDYPTLCSV